MFRQPNKIKEKLKNGETVIGSVIYSWSPNIMEVAGLAGLDFIRIDNEHAWRQDASAENLIRAAVIADVVAIMRIDRENPYLVRKALELGAGGVLVPDVHDAAEVEDIVKAAKFPPRGTRGYSAQNWSGGWGIKGGREWIEWSDSQQMVGVMIENTTAIENINEIVAVEGLDFLLFGPADYSMSLGLGAPNKNHPEVVGALEKTISAGQRYNKPVMMGVGANPEDLKRYKEMGVSMFELASDIAILRSGWSKARQVVEEQG